jgi:hypothetical protein
MLEDKEKLTYLKRMVQLLEHSMKEIPAFKFLQELLGPGLLERYTVT